MSFIRRVEEAAAKKLKRLFLDAKKYADTAVDDLTRAEKSLAEAKVRAAEATARSHQAAIEAAEKAQAAATQLMIEVRAAEERALHYKELIEKSNK